jgi:predicted RNA-binding protein with PIN domain
VIVALLIDGYNLLHVTGLFGRGRASLEASRMALIGFLSAAVPADERTAMTVVFDAAAAPPGLPSHYTLQGLRVHFARGYESADELLEELIAAHPTPRKLTVVSSDHRVQRAATKRRAQAIDSDVWYRAAAEQLKSRRRTKKKPADVKPDAPLSPIEVAAWLREFGVAPALSTEIKPAESVPPKPPLVRRKRSPRTTTTPTPSQSANNKPARARRKTTRRKPLDLGHGDIRNPFPPGYAEGEDLTSG